MWERLHTVVVMSNLFYFVCPAMLHTYKYPALSFFSARAFFPPTMASESLWHVWDLSMLHHAVVDSLTWMPTSSHVVTVPESPGMVILPSAES